MGPERLDATAQSANRWTPRNSRKGFPRLAPLLRPIRREIVDTNTLLKNVKKDVECFPRPTAMRGLRAADALPGAAPDHAEQEMEEKVHRWTVAQKGSPALAWRIWEQGCRLAIRLVAIESLASSNRPPG